MVINGINFSEDKIADFCARHGVKRLSLFGSILRDDFREDSDVDMLVEFGPGEGPSLLGFAGMQLELSSLLGREVHLNTPTMLPPRVRDQLQRDALVQYAA